MVSGARLRPEVVHDFADCWNTGHPDGGQRSRFAGPVLIVRGQADGFVTDELVSGGVAPRFDSVESVFVEGAGHWVHLEQPAEAAGHIDRFLTTRVLPSRATRTPGAAETGDVRPQGWTGAFAQKSSAAFGEATPQSQGRPGAAVGCQAVGAGVGARRSWGRQMITPLSRPRAPKSQ